MNKQSFCFFQQNKKHQRTELASYVIKDRIQQQLIPGKAKTAVSSFFSKTKKHQRIGMTPQTIKGRIQQELIPGKKQKKQMNFKRACVLLLFL